MNHETVWLILRDYLGTRKVCAKLVLRLLTPDEKETRQHISQDWADNWGMFDCVITNDEVWILQDDP